MDESDKQRMLNDPRVVSLTASAQTYLEMCDVFTSFITSVRMTAQVADRTDVFEQFAKENVSTFSDMLAIAMSAKHSNDVAMMADIKAAVANLKASSGRYAGGFEEFGPLYGLFSGAMVRCIQVIYSRYDTARRGGLAIIETMADDEDQLDFIKNIDGAHQRLCRIIGEELDACMVTPLPKANMEDMLGMFETWHEHMGDTGVEDTKQTLASFAHMCTKHMKGVKTDIGASRVLRKLELAGGPNLLGIEMDWFDNDDGGK